MDVTLRMSQWVHRQALSKKLERGKLEHVLPITREQMQWQRASKVDAQAASMSVIYVGRWGNGKQAFPSTAVWMAGFRPADASSFA